MKGEEVTTKFAPTLRKEPGERWQQIITENEKVKTDGKATMEGLRRRLSIVTTKGSTGFSPRRGRSATPNTEMVSGDGR